MSQHAAFGRKADGSTHQGAANGVPHELTVQGRPVDDPGPSAPNAVERFVGHGVIRSGGAAIGETDYDITITPAHLRGATTFEPGSEPLGTNDPQGADITGRLLGSFYDAEKLVEGIHTLVLEDGREFDFRVLQPETNEIVGVSWFRSQSTEGTRTPKA
jgi:hypothetical protein